LFAKLKQIPFAEITSEILLVLKNLVINNRYLRSSNYVPLVEENTKSSENANKFNKANDGKEFEMKEYNKKQEIYTVNWLDNEKIQMNNQTIVKPFQYEEFFGADEENFFTPFGEESKKEENIREINQNNEFLPLIVSHQDNIQNNKKTISSIIFFFC